MNALIQFLLKHGYLMLFGFVFAEQIGLPVPAAPVLLAMGALIGRGHFGFLEALLIAAVASLLGDLIWYELGRRRGHSILSLLCRISLEPDSCVRRTIDAFGKYGLSGLVFAKFVPGLSTAAPPLAGAGRIPWWRFLTFDGAGAFLWVASFLSAGILFSAQLESVAEWALRLGSWLLVVLIGGLALYIIGKYVQRRRFMNKLRIARITPEDLNQRIEANEAMLIVDLRHELEVDELALPGALRFLPDELEARHLEIPRDRDIILYCS